MKVKGEQNNEEKVDIFNSSNNININNMDIKYAFYNF